jgi:hypothetical protein
MAIKLRGTSCHLSLPLGNAAITTISNDIICGGSTKSYDLPASCYYFRTEDYTAIERRCRSGKADAAFLFLTAVTVMAVGVLTYLRMKKGY